MTEEICSPGAPPAGGGIIDFSEEGVGPEYRKEEILRYVKNPPKLTEGFVECEIADVERRFGGAALSVSAKQLSSAGLSPGDLLHVSVRKGGTLLYEGKMRYGISFGSVKPGEPVLYDGSAEGAACISLNRDHFAERCLPSLCRRGEEFSDYKVSIQTNDGVKDRIEGNRPTDRFFLFES